MKKLWVFLTMICIAAVPACAQGKLAETGTAVVRRVTEASRSAMRGTTHTTPRTNSGAARSGEVVARGTAVRGAQGSAGTAAHGAQGAVTHNSNVVEISSNAAAHAPNVAVAHIPKVDPELEALASQAAALTAENAALEGAFTGMTFHADFGKSVLMAPVMQPNAVTGVLEPGGFSVTVVKTNLHGQEELFGVIATHVLKDGATDDVGLHQTFDVTMMTADGTVQKIPAKVVQSSPVSMLDISLVKFDPQYEPLLKPLELADKPADPNEPILSPGFASATPVMVNRTVTQSSLISVRTTLIDVGNRERAGFCGSPLLDSKQRVKAIHTGSAEEKGASYGTHATFINKLVEAYHNNGKATYDLVLDDHVLTTLNVDEYISGIAVLDEGFNVLFKDDGLGAKFEEQWKKYSENKLRNTLQKYAADGEYLVLHSRTPFWDKEADGSLSLVEDRTFSTMAEGNLRVHLYDIKNRQLLYSVGIEDMGSAVQNSLYFDLDGMTIEHGKVVKTKVEINSPDNNDWIDY